MKTRSITDSTSSPISAARGETHDSPQLMSERSGAGSVSPPPRRPSDSPEKGHLVPEQQFDADLNKDDGYCISGSTEETNSEPRPEHEHSRPPPPSNESNFSGLSEASLPTLCLETGALITLAHQESLASANHGTADQATDLLAELARWHDGPKSRPGTALEEQPMSPIPICEIPSSVVLEADNIYQPNAQRPVLEAHLVSCLDHFETQAALETAAEAAAEAADISGTTTPTSTNASEVDPHSLAEPNEDCSSATTPISYFLPPRDVQRYLRKRFIITPRAFKIVHSLHEQRNPQNLVCLGDFDSKRPYIAADRLSPYLFPLMEGEHKDIVSKMLVERGIL